MNLPHFPFWWKDFLAATMHWTDEEVGAYMRLLMHQWGHGCIPTDKRRLSRIIDSTETTWETVSEKFPEGRNQRLEKVREQVIAAHSSAVERGRKGAKTRWRADSSAISPANGSANSPANGKANAQALATKTKRKKDSCALGFAEFYAAYPKKRGKKDALKAWEQTADVRPPLEKILSAIKAQSQTRDWQKDGGQFIPYPATWLRGEQWDDEIETASARAKQYPVLN